MSGAVASFVRMCEYSSGLTDLCDDELLSTMASNHAESTRAKARFLLGLAEFHARQLATSCGSPSTIAWMQRRSQAGARGLGQRRASRHGAPLGDALVTGLIGMINLATTVPRSAARAPGAQVNVILHDDGRLSPAGPSDAVVTPVRDASGW